MFSASKTGISGGYKLTKSLRFRSNVSAYLGRTQGSPTASTKFTWSGWIKRGTSGTYQELFGAGTTANTVNVGAIYIDPNDKLSYIDQPSGTPVSQQTCSAVLRDFAAWYHIVVAVDTTDATSTNRVKIYINGVLQAVTNASTYTQNATTFLNTSGNLLTLSGLRYQAAYTNYFDGYMAEVNFIDGQALTPSSFGSTNAITGVWQPAKYTGTYGNNGFYLPFTDVALTSGSNSGLGKDFSGNTNYWNTNNISVTTGVAYDSMNDVPTLTGQNAANYCVMNPLNSTANISLANLSSNTTSGNSLGANGTLGMSSGKWYWEFTVATLSSGVLIMGIENANYSINVDFSLTYGYGYRNDNGQIRKLGVDSSYGATYTAGDIIGVAFDATNGTITFYKNNTSQGQVTGLVAGTYVPYIYFAGTSITSQVYSNFGQQPFNYTPPTGYNAVNTYNLSDSTIPAGNKYMDATLTTSNGSTQTIVNAGGFKPDLVWSKNRTAGSAQSHYLADSVRGIANLLSTNATNGQSSAPSFITALNSNGWSENDNGVYTNGQTIVGWNWQAGQGSTSSNTNGSITSTVSASATAGFSILTFTCQSSGSGTVGHGLGVAPSFIILKAKTATSGWTVYHSALGNTSYMLLQTSNAVATGATTVWNSTSPTSSVFSIGSAFAGGGDYLGYCWAEIAGFSKFGSYTGNGSANGTFVYTGFRPKYIMTKRSDSTSDWWVQDTSRSPYNAANALLFPNLANAEYTTAGVEMDIVSNGFKLRNTNTSANGSGATIIYAAFAENPFKNALAR